MITVLKGKVDQASPSPIGESVEDYAAMSRFSELFTADWKQRLIRAGLAWQTQVGGITAGADCAVVVGGGAGTTINTDKPELVIGVDAGYFMIVMEASCSAYHDPATDNAINQILLFADRTMAPVSQTASGVAATPVNLLDGGASFPGTSWKQATADITTDPVCSEILDYATNSVAQATGGAAVSQLKMDYKPEAPSILKGPCQVVLCFGGTAANSGMGLIKVAAVPESYFD